MVCATANCNLIPACPFSQGVGATPGCVRRRGRLAEMLLERDRVDDAEKLLRNILGYVESTQVGGQVRLSAMVQMCSWLV